MTDSATLLERLTGLHPRLIDLSLDRMWRILEALGSPQDSLPPVIHVAGTNGKGSVIAYLRAFYEAAGKSVHVYTSPHLAHFHERIRLGRPGGGVLIGEEELSAVLAECERVNDGQPITLFEIITAAALLAFSRHPADILLLEVGMGGRLDSTNVVKTPLASVITPVSLDHTDFLGPDIAAIAGEKAGIIKRGRPVISAAQHPDAASVIASAAARAHAPLFVGGEDWHVYEEHGRMVFQDDAGLLDLARPRLPGRHQLENAGTAIAVLRAVDPQFPVSAIETGLERAEWPARLQNLSGTALAGHAPEGSEIWLDGGHNPAAGRVIAEAMAGMEDRDPRPLYLICGMLRTKDALGFLSAFKDIARRVIAVPVPDSDAGIAPAQLADIASSAGLAVARARDVREALHIVPRIESPRILICGSLYLAGAVLRDLETAQTA